MQTLHVKKPQGWCAHRTTKLFAPRRGGRTPYLQHRFRKGSAGASLCVNVLRNPDFDCPRCVSPACILHSCGQAQLIVSAPVVWKFPLDTFKSHRQHFVQCPVLFATAGRQRGPSRGSPPRASRSRVREVVKVPVTADSVKCRLDCSSINGDQQTHPVAINPLARLILTRRKRWKGEE